MSQESKNNALERLYNKHRKDPVYLVLNYRKKRNPKEFIDLNQDLIVATKEESDYIELQNLMTGEIEVAQYGLPIFTITNFEQNSDKLLHYYFQETETDLASLKEKGWDISSVLGMIEIFDHPGAIKTLTQEQQKQLDDYYYEQRKEKLVALRTARDYVSKCLFNETLEKPCTKTLFFVTKLDEFKGDPYARSSDFIWRGWLEKDPNGKQDSETIDLAWQGFGERKNPHDFEICQGDYRFSKYKIIDLRRKRKESSETFLTMKQNLFGLLDKLDQLSLTPENRNELLIAYFPQLLEIYQTNPNILNDQKQLKLCLKKTLREEYLKKE